MALSLYCTIQQQAFAATAGEIEEKYLKDAENGDTTGVIRDVLAILEWEFNDPSKSRTIFG